MIVIRPLSGFDPDRFQAIRFYRAVGYRMEGVDISYYSNEDTMRGRTVGVFMKRRLR